MGCGWEPEDNRTRLVVLPAGFPEVDECPGYAIRLPEVLEASRALSWKQDGLLSEYFDGDQITPLAKDAVDIMGAEIKEVEAHAIRVARDGHGSR